MQNTPNATIRLYGGLFTLRRERGLPTHADLWIPPEGISGFELADRLELPLDRIEGIFCNHKAYGLDHVVHAGDQIAFIPTGVPGPHRYSLGIYNAGKAQREHEPDA